MIASDAERGRLGSLQGNIAPLRLALGIVVSVAVLAVLYALIDTAQIGEALRVIPEKPGTMTLVALAYTGAFFLRAIAWKLLIAGPAPLGRLFSILQASLFLNHLLPFKAGELARPYLASRNGVPVAEAASTTIVARLTDFAVLALIAAVALPSVAGGSSASVAFQASLALVAVATGAVVLLRQRAVPFLPSKLDALVMRLQDALRQIGAKQVLATLPFVTASWLLEAAVLLGAAELLGIEISVRTAIGATAFAVLFQVVQVTPGGLGVYETSMTTVLVIQGVPAEDALALAVVTHALKFAYSFSIGAVFALNEGWTIFRHRTERTTRKADKFEIVVARCWNVVNEGKPFTPVFVLFTCGLLSLPHIADPAYWLRAVVSILVLAPLFLVFFRFDFPLKLRAALWVYLAAFLAVFQVFDLAAILLVAVLYFGFTIVVWGSIYYHLRIGTSLTNFTRFWRLVLENPDPTSGNFQEQAPKLLILILSFQYLTSNLTWGAVAGIEAFTAVIALTAVLVHQWFFTWVPALPQLLPRRPEEARPSTGSGRTVSEAPPERVSRKVIAIVIDGCRADRLIEADTPFIDRLRREGTDYTNVATVYPARTVTCFSSMFTGAPPKAHGMRSNFVPSLGVKTDTVFESLRRSGLKGKLVGIAHLIDAFGDDIRSVTAVMDNDEIDDALVAQAKRVMVEEEQDLLVLQLLSVDQTGHARGSYYDEYLRKIEITDQKITGFLAWCEAQGYMEDATVLISADHGQGIGIGGHGHMSPTEIIVPCIWWGRGVESGVVSDAPMFVTDIASTVCRLLGAEEPRDSVGRPMLPVAAPDAERPVVYVIPAKNEEANLPAVLANIARTATAPYRAVVVDDGSRDRTAEVAAAHGAVVVRHETNRGLGAALRSGLEEARRLDARAAVYLDADGEYDPAEASRLLAPIESGEADYVLGSRFKGSVKGMTLSRRFANACFSGLLSLLAGRWISDGQTGYRAFSPRALEVAEIIHDYNYAQVLTLDLLRKGMRMREVPITYQRRTLGRSFVKTDYLWRVPVAMAREMLGD